MKSDDRRPVGPGCADGVYETGTKANIVLNTDLRTVNHALDGGGRGQIARGAGVARRISKVGTASGK